MGDLSGDCGRQLLFFCNKPCDTLSMCLRLLLKQYSLIKSSMNQQTSLPPFSLYNIGTDNSKTCLQSRNLTLICDLVGPYFDRNKISNDPIFNCNIIGSSLKEEKVSSLGRKIKEIVGLSVVKEKYMRMNFDVNFHVVEIKNKDELMPALVNLLCFSLMLAGVELKSVFSCSQVWLVDEKISWERPAGSEKDVKKMCMTLQSSQKEILYTEFEGEYAFVHFQRLSNLLMDANQQIHSYMIKKVWQLNDQLQS